MERYYVGCDKRGNETYNTNTNQKNNERKEITGLTRITKKRLKELCKKDKLYQTPALNDVLYLHYQGIDCIECLEEYTGLKCLWLESNAISEIQGLDNQKQLKCLFLQSNLIKRIDNLENCPELDTLNLASNHIRQIENCGFDVLPVLSTLNLSSNFLKDFDGLKDLENCKTLSVLDLSNNRIDDILVVKIFAKMPQLRVLALQGNPVVSKLPQYRKTLILECKELTYLDSRPVFPKDRACAEAWKAGGYVGERKENARWNRMERKKIRDSVNATIRMRNKHKPPDQQDALFNSSDSEDDMAETKRQRQAEVDAGINMELGIWEEVVNDDTKTETSSDMNISSSTSGLNTTDSNANISEDSKSIEIHANQDREEEKVANNSADTKCQLLEISRDGNMAEILKVVDIRASEAETKGSENKDILKGQKRMFIEEIPDAGRAENGEIANSVVDDLLDNEIIPAVLGEIRSLDRPFSADNLSDSDDTNKDEYNATVNAIRRITMNDLSTPSPKKRIKLQIEVDESLGEVEVANEIAATQSEATEKEVAETPNEELVIKEKTREQIKYEKECEEANQKVVEDFEELSTYMDNFFEEMQQSTEGVNIVEAKDDHLAKQDSETEVTVNSCTKLGGNGGILEEIVATEDVKIYGKEQEENTSGSGSDVPPEASSLTKVVMKVEAMRNDVPGDHADIPTETDKFEKAIIRIEKVPLEFKRPQEQTNATYEHEERELRQLLQKLEDENEQLYNLNNTYRHVLEEDIREEIKYQDKEKSDDCVGICEEIIKDLLDELTSKKPKSFEFGVIESDDEYSYSDPPKLTEPPTRTIREVLSSFNDLLQDIARKNREEEDCKERVGMEALKRKHSSTEAEKAASLHNLLSSPNLRNFNGDTKEILDEQIAAEKKRETQRVRKLVDRVYAQKDKYYDTLDVVDGKLVVVKKDTGEIEDLPESKLTYSDSEGSDAYKSANSDNEEDTAPTRFWDTKVHKEERVGGFKLPYRPTERISAMTLIQKTNALKEKEEAEREAADEEDKESNEKFYSLEANKPANFHNIDEEFIEKLNFEKAAFEKEADERVECARSYTELKQIVKENKEDLNLTDDENVMLQKMLGRAEKEETTKQPTNALTTEENELLHKLVQRTKEKEKAIEAEVREVTMTPTLSKQTLKILEFNNSANSNSETIGNGDREKNKNFMNMKQLNAQFPIPNAFRDMLGDYDIGRKATHVTSADSELTVLYMKENKNNDRQEYDEREVLICGSYEQPLQLSRGGVLYATYEGNEEEVDEFKDISCDDILPKSENKMVRASLEDQQEVSEKTMEISTQLADAGDTAPEQQQERLSDVAASLLTFDGSNYEEFGIDKETARGVVEYEKMLNFGYEEEEEFIDAPMHEEELMKIVKEALKKDEFKEEGECSELKHEGGSGTKQGFERSLKASYETKDGGTQEEYLARKVEKLIEKQMSAEDETEMKAELEKRIKTIDGKVDLKKSEHETDEHGQGIGQEKKLLKETKFQELSDEHKDVPARTIDAGGMATENQASEEDTNSTNAATKSATSTNELQCTFEDFKVFRVLGNNSVKTNDATSESTERPASKENTDSTQMPHPSASSVVPELSPKRLPNTLAKRRSIQNLLKSPNLKQFNNDTSESLDAQIKAATEDDFDVIECSLQVIGDNDEVVNEISVNADITYRA
ncbi:dynein axonemal assembly factor 1 homolog [Eurosta solidaginis]|uniref:dynein axonemal assembly factor 1 homolog n=1 Tax=Eurosta solidaginis TaxID=178769 RepID=UPI00353095A7